MIETVDFNRNRTIGESNYRNRIPEKACRLAAQAVRDLGFDEDFEIYLGFELGNINGFSCPNSKGKPFVYLGLDTELEEGTFKNIIPHEINHMVRSQKVKDIDSWDFLERVLSEGLGVASSLVLNQSNFSPEGISKALALLLQEVEKPEKRLFLFRKVTDGFGSKLTEEMMQEYFTWSEASGKDNLKLGGYYVGLMIVKKMLDKGFALAELTSMPSILNWNHFKEIA